MEDRIEKTIELTAPVARVWRALTDHEEFGVWFRVKLDGPFVVGEVSRGRITYPGYEHMKWEATVQAMESERLFSFTWCPYALDPNIDYSNEPRTLVEFRLEPTANGTRLLISESGFNALPDDARRLDSWRRNTQGWNEQAKNITAHVGS
jgi:uncharacterized protein YndB with AHSA1/START domain